MGHKLKTIITGSGEIITEKACENYICFDCWAKMNSVNFVNGTLIQVFSTHKDDCRFVSKNNYKTGEATCGSCVYHTDNEECSFEGVPDGTISRLHY